MSDGPVSKHVIQAENDRLRGEVERLTRERDTALVGAEEMSDKHAEEFNAVNELCLKLSDARFERDAAIARAEAAERERDEWMAAAAQEREASEAAERERDEAKEHHEKWWSAYEAQRNELFDRAEAAEAKVAKLREALKPFATEAEFCDEQTRVLGAPSLDNDDGVDVNMGDLRRARAVLQETSDVD